MRREFLPVWQRPTPTIPNTGFIWVVLPRHSRGGYYHTGDSQGAFSTGRQALEQQQRLVAEYPEVQEYQAQLANALGDMALVLEVSGQKEAAVGLAKQSVAILEGLDSANAQSGVYRIRLANGYSLLARMFVRALHYQDSIQPSQNALAMFKDALKTDSGNPVARARCANQLVELGRQMKFLGDYDGALPVVEEGLREWEALHREYPSIESYTYGFSLASASIATCFEYSRGDDATSLQHRQKGIELLHELLVVNPSSLMYELQLSYQFFSFGLHHHRKSRYVQAIPLLTEGIQRIEHFLAANPDVADARKLYIELAQLLVLTQHDIGQSEKILETYHRHIAPDEPALRAQALSSNARWLLTKFVVRDPMPEKALELAREAVEVERNPETLETLAMAYDSNGMLQDAVETLETLLRSEISDEMRSELELRLKDLRERL